MSLVGDHELDHAVQTIGWASSVMAHGGDSRTAARLRRARRVLERVPELVCEVEEAREALAARIDLVNELAAENRKLCRPGRPPRRY